MIFEIDHFGTENFEGSFNDIHIKFSPHVDFTLENVLYRQFSKICKMASVTMETSFFAIFRDQKRVVDILSVQNICPLNINIWRKIQVNILFRS